MKDPLFEPAHNLIVATPADLTFVLSLQQRFSNALGFLAREALDWYLEAGRVTLALDNDQPAGYVLGREKFRWNLALRPITQAAIDYSAQRRHHGLAMVSRVAADAREAGQMAIQAMCRSDLDANEFWRIAGYVEIGRYAPKNQRKAEMICWRHQLTPHEPAWFDVMPPVAGWKAKRTNAPRKLEQPRMASPPALPHSLAG